MQHVGGTTISSPSLLRLRLANHAVDNVDNVMDAESKISAITQVACLAMAPLNNTMFKTC
jgi:hypothetical protein